MSVVAKMIVSEVNTVLRANCSRRKTSFEVHRYLASAVCFCRVHVDPLFLPSWARAVTCYTYWCKR